MIILRSISRVIFSRRLKVGCPRWTKPLYTGLQYCFFRGATSQTLHAKRNLFVYMMWYSIMFLHFIVVLQLCAVDIYSTWCIAGRTLCWYHKLGIWYCSTRVLLGCSLSCFRGSFSSGTLQYLCLAAATCYLVMATTKICRGLNARNLGFVERELNLNVH